MSRISGNVLGAAFAAILLGLPVTGHAEEKPCYPPGSPPPCFDFQCLPPDKSELSPMQVDDVELKVMCLKMMEPLNSTTDRKAVPAAFRDECTKVKGTFKQAGIKLTCQLPATKATAGATRKAAVPVKTGECGPDGVWAGEDGKGDCTGGPSATAKPTATTAKPAATTGTKK